jgi:CRP/FNR family transcriptional regulator
MILRIAQTGEVLGLSAALANGEFEVTAEVLEPSCVRVLKSKDFAQMLRRYEETNAAAAKSLACDYKAALDDARMLALSSSAKSRLAILILRWSATNAKLPIPSAFIKMTFTHDDLGAMTATSRETMTRALGQLQRDKIISVHGIALTVLNQSALEALATS